MKLVKNLLIGALFVAISTYMMSCSNSNPVGTTDNLSSQTFTQETSTGSILQVLNNSVSDTVKLIIPVKNNSVSNSLSKDKATAPGAHYEVLLIPVDKRYTDGITVTVNNVGALPLDFLISCNLNIYNVNNEKVKSIIIREAIYKSKTYTFQISMSNSVVEKIVVENVKINGNSATMFATGYRYKQIGGSYGSINAMGGERHHCFAADIYNYTTVYRYDSQRKIIGTVSASYAAPCVLMTSEDHMLTKSWGNRTGSPEFRHNN